MLPWCSAKSMCSLVTALRLPLFLAHSARVQCAETEPELAACSCRGAFRYVPSLSADISGQSAPNAK
eukprot:9502348-Pyramimonas_sp.AAC.1